MSKPADMDRLRRDIDLTADEMVAEVDRLKQLVSDIEDERDALKTEVQELTAANASLQSRVDELESEQP